MSNVLPVALRKFTLNNGTQMPVIGMGTFRISDEDSINNLVNNALACGYRMFDTACVYGNEVYLKNALVKYLPQYGLKREDIFITTKLAPKDHGGPGITDIALYSSLERNLQYIDLYLIHWPGSPKIHARDTRNAELRDKTWQTLAEMYKNGLVRAIGVSNYTVRHLKQLLANDHGVIPAVNQVEWHPYLYDVELQKLCQDNGIVLQAYCSFGGTSIDNKALLNEPALLRIAQKFKVTPPRVLLRWAVQQNVAVIPKAMSVGHMKDNINLDFDMSEEDLGVLNGFNRVKERYAWDPNTVE